MNYTDQWARRFTYEDRFGEEVLHFVQKGELIGCPRAAFQVGDVDERVRGDDVLFKQIDFVPRDGQGEFIAAATKLLAQDESFVAQAPTGWGKTVVATQIIRAVGRPTLVIVTKEDLLERWAGEIQKWLGVGPGVIQADTWDLRPITLAMVHTLAQRGIATQAAKQFGFVIWDECHRMAADTFSRTAFQFPALLRMGLSATPQRLDGREQMIFDTIGPIRVVHEALQLKPQIALCKSTWQSPRWRCKGCKGAGCPACGGRGYKKAHAEVGKTMHLEKDIAAHPERNAQILKIVARAHSKGRRIVVFSTLVAHLKFLRSKLIEHLGVPPEDTALYISGLSQKGREQAKAKPVIFATWGMMGEGTDVPWLDVCVLGTPRANVEQPIGRVLREYPGKPQPIVVDICDYDHPVFEKYAAKRRKLYASMRAPVKEYAS
jgi:superfamily II DNA or RNA helicase